VRNVPVHNQIVFNNFITILDRLDNHRLLYFTLGLTDIAINLINEYNTQAFPKAYIENAILVQPWNQSEIRVLPPNHPDVETVFS